MRYVVVVVSYLTRAMMQHASSGQMTESAATLNCYISSHSFFTRLLLVVRIFHWIALQTAETFPVARK